MKKNHRKLYGYITTNRAKHNLKIHLMIQYIPRLSISSIVNRIKSITKRIWSLHQNFLRKHFWKEKTFWTDEYFVCSIGEASPETIQNYIRNQS